MSVHDAELGDIYVDDDGKLWRVIAICGEPTVHVQEVETVTPESPVKKLGGVSGFMWHGFRRIHRPEPKKQPGKYRLDGSAAWQA
jgi:hypothetical protein